MYSTGHGVSAGKVGYTFYYGVRGHDADLILRRNWVDWNGACIARYGQIPLTCCILHPPCLSGIYSCKSCGDLVEDFYCRKDFQPLVALLSLFLQGDLKYATEIDYRREQKETRNKRNCAMKGPRSENFSI